MYAQLQNTKVSWDAIADLAVGSKGHWGWVRQTRGEVSNQGRTVLYLGRTESQKRQR